MTGITIHQLSKPSPYIEEVRLLADKNSATLGFLPAPVFEEFATKNGILIALEDDKLAGYVLYRISKRSNKVTIVHFCVDENYRGKGVSQKLFEELRSRTLAFRGIGLNCRRDYEHANELWRRNGFIPQSEKAGRAKKTRSELTYWWFDHGHKTLFDIIDTEKLQVVIDANIFFDFQKTHNIEPENHALLGDWIRDEVDFLVTPELLVEINRQPNEALRNKNRRKAQEFHETQKDHKKHSEIYQQLMQLASPKNENDESDLKHIAWAIADPSVNLYVTSDTNVLKLSSAIFDKYQLSILHPVDLILRLDEYARLDEYRRHMRLAGTNIEQRRIQSGEQDKLARFFQNQTVEKQTDFLKILRPLLVGRETSVCFVVEDNNSTPLLLFSYERTDPRFLRIPLLRINENKPDKQILRYLLLQFMAISARENRSFLCVSDPHLQELSRETLQEDTFIQVDRTWYKPTISHVASTDELAQHLETELNRLPEVKPYYQLHVNLLRDTSSHSNTATMAEIERIFWPVKITNADISTVTIPINSHWAYLWFDETLAKQTLFGSLEERAFNREGVYYSAATPPNIKLPARIVWYVTKEEGVLGTQSLRACSRLDNIVVGKPKDLYRQFKHLGIYDWKDLVSGPGADLNKDIVAYRFSDTQLFSRPITYNEWKEVTIRVKEKKPPIQSPAVMPNEIFTMLYQMGTETLGK